MQKTNDLDPLSTDGMDSFLEAVVRMVVDQRPQAEIYENAVRLGHVFLPDFAAQSTDREGADVFFRLLAREACDRTPRPELRFATRKVERPGRNDPCSCGSGRKYKQCCGPLEHMPMPFDQLNLLPYVLDCLPRRQWAQLVGSAVNHDAVAHAARELIDDGEYAAALDLLEPWFAGTGEIPARNELLLDLLLDTHHEMGKPRKKMQLLEDALRRGDRAIRSSALQRLASISADAGDFEKAWRCFHEAQREHADSASLSHLEVTLLISQGEEARASERARFWVARLSRQDAREHKELIALLRQVAEQGESAMFAVSGGQWPELQSLRELLSHAPAPAVMHRLKHGDAHDAGAITPVPALAKAIKLWQKAFPQVAPALTGMQLDAHPAWDDADPWLECLRVQPNLWQSFDVLDDLVLALTAIPAPGVRQKLADPLLARAEGLFEGLLEAEAAQGKTLQWGCHDNRPALRLLAQRIVGDLHDSGDPIVARMERMLALNPNDNHGFRGYLMTAYLRRSDFGKATQLAQLFEDDAEMAFSHVLALWASGRAGDALLRLRDAHGRLPLLLPMLLAKNPRKPRLTPGFFRYGGKDQAWLVRENQLPAWESVPGALDWLRKAQRALKKSFAP